jgi:hypothetical protein
LRGHPLSNGPHHDGLAVQVCAILMTAADLWELDDGNHERTFIIRASKARLTIALAAVEGDDPDPNGGNEADDCGGETVAA